MTIAAPPGVFSITQIIGYVAYAVTIAAFWQKRDRRLLLLNGLGALFWTVQYIMLGAWAGAVTEALVTMRSTLSAYITEKKHQHLTAVIFTAAFLIGGVLTYRQWYDTLTMAACIVGTISMVYLEKIMLRWGTLLAVSLWFAYNFFTGSIGGALAGATLIATQIMTLVRMYRDKKLETAA